jgi:phosphoglycolate phosphatase-like HAD superfamily hydrolase
MIPQKLTLLFDLDGTLMHEWESAEYCFIETLHRAGITASSADVFQTVRPIAREEWYKLPTIDYCLKIGFSSWEALWSDFSYDNAEFAVMRQLERNIG